MEWLIGITVVVILDILALEHIASPRTERDRNSWRR